MVRWAMTRAELEAMARSMGLPLQEAATLLGETSVLQGPPRAKLHVPAGQPQKEISMTGVHPPPIVPGKLG